MHTTCGEHLLHPDDAHQTADRRYRSWWLRHIEQNHSEEALQAAKQCLTARAHQCTSLWQSSMMLDRLFLYGTVYA